MYRNYDFGYGMPPRRRVPDFPFRGPTFHHRFGNPYMDADPYLGYRDRYMEMAMRGPPMRPRIPRSGGSRGGISDWGAQLINKQIKKAQERILGQYKQQGTNVSATEKESSETTPSSKNDGENQNTVETEKSETQSADKESPVEENKAKTTPEPTVPIGPRIPAKQMWESSYRETVSEKEEGSSSMPAPSFTPSENAESSAGNKRRQKTNKFRRGPYFKRKKKTGNANETETDTNGNATAPSSGEDSGFPRMCQVCNVQLTGEEQSKIHNESQIHKDSVNKFLTGDDKKTLNMTLDKLNETVPLPTNTPDCVAWAPDTGDRTLNTVRFCRLCSVRMTSLPNAKQHYEGKSHAKRIRIVQRGNRPVRKPFQPTHFVSGGLLGLQSKPIQPAYSYGTSFVPVQPQTNPTAINLNPVLPGEFANSMTPSGQYYCATCNVMIEYAGKLNSHLQSKAHKLALSRTATS